MLVYKQGNIISSYFNSIVDYLQAGDVLVFNDVKVIKAKLEATILRSGKKVEFNLDRQLFDNEIKGALVSECQDSRVYWVAICKGIKKVRDLDGIKVAEDFTFRFEKKLDDGFCIISSDIDGFFDKLEVYGNVPLPPYIKRGDGSQKHDDDVNYQTIYANKGYGVAAPTAGLHFDDDIFLQLEKVGVKKEFVTLNVGAGTFLPVRSENIKDHKMHEEYYELSPDVALRINEAKKNGARIIAVGTTSLRVLESSIDDSGNILPFRGKTDIFIYPGCKVRSIDALLTNFHLPKSTLFMLVCAFIGTVDAKKMYNQAIVENYKFFSYGDSSLLIP